MTELAAPTPRREEQPTVREVRYPGFTTTLREITTQPKDAGVIAGIERALDPDEYEEIGDFTPEDAVSWLRSGVTRNFNSINPGSKRRAAVGIEERKDAAAEEMIIATTSFGKAEELAAYAYVYFPDTIAEDVLERHGAQVNREISYVTAVEDKDRDVDQMAQSFMQTAMLLWEKSVGKTIAELDGKLTPEQIIGAKEKLAIFADTGTEENEARYREGLARAGYQQISTYEKEGKERLVFQLPLESLVAAFDQK